MKPVLLLVLLAFAWDGTGAETQVGGPTDSADAGTRPTAAADEPSGPKKSEPNEAQPGEFNFFNLPASKTPPRPATPPPPAPPAPAAGIPPAAPVVPAAPKQPTVKEFRSLDELLVPVPLDQDLFTDGRVNAAAVQAANAVVEKATVGKPIAVRVPFRDLVTFRRGGFKLRGEAQPLTLRGRKVTGYVEVLFREDQAAAVGRLGKGSVVPVKGTVSRAEISGELRTLDFRVVIADGALQ